MGVIWKENLLFSTLVFGLVFRDGDCLCCWQNLTRCSCICTRLFSTVFNNVQLQKLIVSSSFRSSAFTGLAIFFIPTYLDFYSRIDRGCNLVGCAVCESSIRHIFAVAYDTKPRNDFHNAPGLENKHVHWVVTVVDMLRCSLEM